MAVESPAFANQAKTYSAEQTRRAVFSQYTRTSANSPGIISGGLMAMADLQLSPPGSGLSVNVGAGEAIVPGNEGGAQGGYYARATSTTNLTIATADPTNPRIDTVCATISDTGYTEPTGGSGDQWALQVVTGTPTAGATLPNLNGKAALPGSSLLLGYVLVPAAASSIVTADILNVAAQATLGLPDLAWVSGVTSFSILSGQWTVAAASQTVTLPTPSKNAQVMIVAATNVVSSTAVTVQAGASGTIYVPGMGGSVTSFKLGTGGAFVVLESDGSTWWIASGQVDTGWIALTAQANWTIGATAILRGTTVTFRGTLTNNTGGAASYAQNNPAGIPSAPTPQYVPLGVGAAVNPLQGIVATGLSAPNTGTVANGTQLQLGFSYQSI